MPSNEVGERLLTAEEVAQYLGYSVGTVYNKVSRGEIPHLKLGRTIRFRRSEIDTWIKEQNADPEAAEEADQVEAEEVA